MPGYQNMTRLFTYFVLHLLLSLKLSSQTADCKTTETYQGEDTNPIITKTCTYKNIKTVVIPVGDFTGYSYKYQLFYNDHLAKNSEIFNADQGKLLARVNEAFRSKVNAYKSKPGKKDCFPVKYDFQDQKMNSLGIEFDQDKIKFTCALGLSKMCADIDLITVTLDIKDVEKYFKE
jgi:hypothetical protein